MTRDMAKENEFEADFEDNYSDETEMEEPENFNYDFGAPSRYQMREPLVFYPTTSQLIEMRKAQLLKEMTQLKVAIYITGLFSEKATNMD